MCKRLFFLISIVLALSLVGNASAALVGYWNFDDGTANDSSGNNHHGTFMDDATTVIDGNIPGLGAGNRALTLDGTEDYVNCGKGAWADFVTNAMTIAIWTKLPDGYSNDYQSAMAKSETFQWYRNYNGSGIRLYTNGTEDIYINYNPEGDFPYIYLDDGEWHHTAVTFNGASGVRHIYIDGYQAQEESVISTGFALSTYDLSIGARVKFENRWKGLLDECYIYDNALTHAEILEMAANYKAYAPVPTDGAQYQKLNLASIGWKKGVKAAATGGHKVYLGTSEALVDANDPSVYKAPPVDGNTYSASPMGSLTEGTEYYWRINAVNGLDEWPGIVWSFKTVYEKSSEPSPVDGGKYTSISRARVSWRQGTEGTRNAVYFGTSKALIDANDPSVYKGDFWVTSDPNWPISPALVADETYYWRIDANFPSFDKIKGNVWSFETVTPIADANLIGWWPMEERDASGTVTWDITGNEHHGTLKYNANLIADGNVGLAGNKVLGLDGMDYVNVGGGKADVSDPRTWADIDQTFGITCWVRLPDGYKNAYQPAVAKSESWQWYRNSDGNGIRLYTNDTSDAYINYNPKEDFPYIYLDDGEWHHTAATFDGAAGMRKIWIDGKLAPTESVIGSFASSTYDMSIGARLKFANRWKGQLDDVRFYNRVLTTEDVILMMRFDPNVAWNPHPSDGDQTVNERPLTLNWRPGDKVQATNEHKVYFGTDEALVDACDVNVYQGLRDVNNLPAGSLDYSKWYYWKVIEVNGATEWPGKTWAFRMNNFIPWEDFESYEVGGVGPKLISNVWIRNTGTGGGATIGLGTTVNYDPVNGGDQSMKYTYYLNSMAAYYYAEASRDFGGDPCDWTWATGGVKSLRLYFYGDPGNIPIDMYVVLEDSNTNDSMKLYDRSSSDLTVEDWQEWDIDLSWFTDGTNNVHLGYIEKVYIGFGVRSATSVSTNFAVPSVMYFDDFRAYPPHCVPDRLKPAGDVTGNCIVDYVDANRMAAEWLDDDYTITPSNPSDSNLVGYWNFDDGSANDSSGNNHHGTLTAGGAGTSVAIVDDIDRGNKVLKLNNPDVLLNSVVDCGGGPGDADPNWAYLKEQISIAAWCKVDTFFQLDQYMLTCGASYHLRRYQTTGGAGCYMIGLSDTILSSVYIDPTHILDDGEWHHVACTYDSTAQERIVYIDGRICNTDTPSGLLRSDDESFIIGGRLVNYDTRGWDGKIDEVRLYDDVLTQAEVVYLMTGSTSPQYFDVWSAANLTDVGDPCGLRFVNFKDYNILANTWFDGPLLYPSGW